MIYVIMFMEENTFLKYERNERKKIVSYSLTKINWYFKWDQKNRQQIFDAICDLNT